MIKKLGVVGEDKKMCKQIFRRTVSLSAPYNYEKMQALAYLYTMIPVINRYHKKEEDRIAAYQRHWELFNTTPTVAGFITGLSAAMEKQASEDPSFDTKSINAVKTSLMGPFAGIGDSIFWGTWRVVSAGIGLSLALEGNVLGPILFLIVFNVPATFIRYIGPFVGFGLGSKFLTKATESGLMQFLTKAASIVGLMTVGAMTCSMVKLKTTFVYSTNGADVVLQEMLDSIFPNLLPLALTFLCFTLVRKGMKANWIILLMIAVGILGRFLGIL